MSASEFDAPIPVSLFREVPAPAQQRLEPLADCVLFRVVDATRTEGGLYVPEQVETRKRCVVIAVGPGRYLDDGTRLTPQVRVGDQIVLWATAPKPYGTDITGETIWFCRDTDVAARVVATEGQS